MRRTTQGVLIGDEVSRDSCPADPEEVIAALEPIVTPARIARFAKVFGDRLDAVTLVVDALHDPHNGAALVRSCDAFGVQTMHVVERMEAIAVASSVARGSQKWVDVRRHPDSGACLAELAGRGYELVATHPEGELLPDALSAIPRLALLLGNEREGIAPELRAACTRAVRVPMVGFVESLNVSVTAAILLFAATRGRPGDLSVARRRALYARALWLTVPRPAERLEHWRLRSSSLPPD